MKRRWDVLKKLTVLAACLVIAMLCIAAGVCAEGDLSVKKGDPDKAAATGIYGKTADDKALEISVTDISAYRYNYPVKFDPFGGYKYLVYEANIAPDYGVKTIYLQTTSSARVSDKVTEYNEKQWNNVMFVYEIPTTQYPKGRTTCYVNGAAAFTDRENVQAFNGTDVRIAIDSTLTQNIANRQDLHAYIDDLNVYLTNTLPQAPQMPQITGNTTAYKISGNKLLTDGTITFGTIKEDGKTVTGYKADNTALKDTDVLNAGDKVVVCNTGMKLYTTYTAEQALPEKYDDLLPVSKPNKETTVVTLLENFGGMTKDDKLYRVTTPQDEAGNVNINWNNIDIYSGYLVIEGNAYIENGSFRVTFENSPVLKDCSNTKEWFHFMTVIDKKTASNNIKTYINGKAADTMSIAIDKAMNVRLRLEKNSSVVFDDVRMYYTQSEPVVTQLPGVEKSSLLFDKYINGSGKTAADFSGTNVRAKAFTAKAIGEATENTGKLNAGDYVLIYDETNRVYNGYTVAEYAAAGNTITYKYPSGASVIIAEYDKDNKLVKATCGTVSGGIAAAEHTLEKTENTFKVFTLNSFSDIKPLENVIPE